MDLNAALAKHGVLDFKVYINGISGPEIFRLLREGAGIQSMSDASRPQWELSGALKRIAERYQQVIGGLTQGWSGPSIEEMVAELQRRKKWLEDAAEVALETAKQVVKFAKAFESETFFLVTPETFGENREKTWQLLESNTAEKYTAEIAQLEAQYDCWQAENTERAISYYDQAVGIMALCEKWPTLPDAGGFASAASRVKRAGR